MNNLTLRRLAVLGLTASLSGCFDDSSYTPLISNVLDLTFGGTTNGVGIVDIGATSLHATGAFFPPGSVVYWNGKPQTTTFGSGGLDFALDPGLTDDAGDAQVSIGTAAGPLSNALTTAIEQTSVSVTSYSPVSANPGDGPLTLTVNGAGFVTGAQVLWNATPLSTTLVNGHQLTAAVPASLLANAGTATVQIQVPCCAGFGFFPFNRSLPFPVGQSKITAVGDGSSSDLAGDATSGNLYGFENGFSGGLLLTIDPVAATATTTAIPSSDIVRLAISDQNQFLYAIHENFSNPTANQAPTRYTLPGFTDVTQVSDVTAIDVLPAPGLPATAALITASDIAIVDGTSLRPNRLSVDFTSAAVDFTSAAVWGFDSSTLYVQSGSFFSQVQRYTVGPSGIDASPTLVTSTFHGALFYDRTLRRLYGTAGANLDEQGNSHGTFVLPVDRFGRSLCPVGLADGANGKVFFACEEDQIGLTIHSYDADTSATLGVVALGGPTDTPPIKMVRWGTNGLAVAAGSQIWIYSGGLVH